MPAKRRKTDTAARSTTERQIPSPCSPTWSLAVHESGHCVMAYLLGIGILRGVIRAAENTGNVWWRHAAKRYSHVFHDSHGRSVLEEDALVALAGAAAQWLYKQGSVRASAMSFDDEMATSILAGMEPEMNVA
jgi:hypothetical protein